MVNTVHRPRPGTPPAWHSQSCTLVSRVGWLFPLQVCFFSSHLRMKQFLRGCLELPPRFLALTLLTSHHGGLPVHPSALQSLMPAFPLPSRHHHLDASQVLQHHPLLSPHLTTPPFCPMPTQLWFQATIIFPFYYSEHLLTARTGQSPLINVSFSGIIFFFSASTLRYPVLPLALTVSPASLPLPLHLLTH